MNILILHSATVDLIEKFCKKYKNDNIYVCTYKRNSGKFSKYAKEVYFKDNSSRINAYEIIDEIRDYIFKLKVDQLFFITSNVYGENYENISILYNSIDFNNKKILNNNLEPISLKNDFSIYMSELLYEYEDIILKEYVNKRNSENKLKSIKKIMFIYDSFYMGGVTNLIYEWIKKLEDKFNIVYSCYSNGVEFDKFNEMENIKLYVQNMNVFEANAQLNYYNFLKDVMNKERPDVVFIFGISTFLPSMLAAIDCSISKIYPIANISYYEVFGSVNIGKYLRLFEEKYTKIISVSNAVKKSIVDLGVNKDKIEVIYGTSIDINKIDTVKESKDSGKKIISCICRLSKEKGIDTLIEAISKIDLIKYNNFEVYIVGEGDEKLHLNNLVKELNLEHIIKFLGYRKDISTILNNTYISVLPSHHEGLPLSILESMAYGKMVIATNVDGIPEVIEHKKNGLLINENDSDMLAGYIEICLENSQLVEKMNHNARQSILEKFNVDVCIKKITKLMLEE